MGTGKNVISHSRHGPVVVDGVVIGSDDAVFVSDLEVIEHHLFKSHRETCVVVLVVGTLEYKLCAHFTPLFVLLIHDIQIRHTGDKSEDDPRLCLDPAGGDNGSSCKHRK